MGKLTLAAVWLLVSYSASMAQNPLLRLTLDDGSQVIGKCTAPLKIKTEHGALAINMDSLYAVDLGPRLTEKDDTAYRKLLATLDSDDHTAREDAHKALEKMGAKLYPFLIREHGTAKSMEVKRRVEQLFKKLEETCAKADLAEWREDHFTAAGLSGNGHIIDPSIQIESALLGKLDIPLAHVSRIDSSGRAFTTSINADQGTWHDTGLSINGSWVLRVSGVIDLWAAAPGQYLSRGDGIMNVPGLNSGYNAGSLLYHIGERPLENTSGSLLSTGQIVRGSGRLYVKIVQTTWQGSQVSGKLTIEAKQR